ncbi:MAG: DUF2231 domain-containing protein [Nitrospinaceae bacterium]
MFDLPLHPVVVHFPIVLGFLLPFTGLLLWWAIKKEHLPAKAWTLVIALAFVYSVSAVVTAQLGERDEEKVEKVVSEKLIEEHEEAAEWVPWTAGTLFLISLAGLLRKNPHQIRLAIALLSLAAVVPVANAGHTGGKLVYQYGAANAHLLPKYKALVQSGKFYLVHKDDKKQEENEED